MRARQRSRGWPAVALIALGLPVTLAPANAPAQSSTPLSFRIEASRPSVRSGERVVISLMLGSAAPTLANARLVVGPEGSPVHEVSFRVEDAEHRVLPFRLVVQSRPPRDTDFVEVAPARPVERRYDLARAFDLRTPGTYSIRATYRSTAQGPAGRQAFAGSLSSNAIRITVTAP